MNRASIPSDRGIEHSLSIHREEQHDCVGVRVAFVTDGGFSVGNGFSDILDDPSAFWDHCGGKHATAMNCRLFDNVETRRATLSG